MQYNAFDATDIALDKNVLLYSLRIVDTIAAHLLANHQKVIDLKKSHITFFTHLLCTKN